MKRDHVSYWDGCWLGLGVVMVISLAVGLWMLFLNGLDAQMLSIEATDLEQIRQRRGDLIWEYWPGILIAVAGVLVILGILLRAALNWLRGTHYARRQ